MCHVKYGIAGSLQISNTALLFHCQIHDCESEFGHPKGHQKGMFYQKYLELLQVLIMNVNQEFLFGTYCFS